LALAEALGCITVEVARQMMVETETTLYSHLSLQLAAVGLADTTGVLVLLAVLVEAAALLQQGQAGQELQGKETTVVWVL
jgi:hypothetical protein